MDNQLGFKSLIASNKHTTIPTCHQHLSSRPDQNFPNRGALYPAGNESRVHPCGSQLFRMHFVCEKGDKREPVELVPGEGVPGVDRVLNFLKHMEKWPLSALREGCGVSGGLSTPGQV